MPEPTESFSQSDVSDVRQNAQASAVVPSHEEMATHFGSRSGLSAEPQSIDFGEPGALYGSNASFGIHTAGSESHATTGGAPPIDNGKPITDDSRAPRLTGQSETTPAFPLSQDSGQFGGGISGSGETASDTGGGGQNTGTNRFSDQAGSDDTPLPVQPRSNMPGYEVPSAPITAAGVRQSNYGDCFFEASLASLAQTSQGRNLIESMVKQNADGSSTVTFPGDPEHPVNVTSGDLDKYQVGNPAQFANVIETALLKYNNVTRTGNDALASGTTKTADDALRLLTGNEVDGVGSQEFFSGQRQLSLESVANTIQNALKHGSPIVAVSDNIPPILQSQTGDLAQYSSSKFPIAGGHEYSVTGFDSQTGTVTVRNPWGNNQSVPITGRGKTLDGITNVGDGKLSMSLSTFATYFNDVRTATQQPDGQSKYLGAIESAVD